MKKRKVIIESQDSAVLPQSYTTAAAQEQSPMFGITDIPHAMPQNALARAVESHLTCVPSKAVLTANVECSGQTEQYCPVATLEPTRIACRKLLSQIMLKGLAHKSSSKSFSHGRATEIADAIEECIARIFNETISDGYKRQIKTHVNCIRKNTDLQRKLLDGVVTPDEVAHMSSDDMRTTGYCVDIFLI